MRIILRMIIISVRIIRIIVTISVFQVILKMIIIRIKITLSIRIYPHSDTNLTNI